MTLADAPHHAQRPVASRRPGGPPAGDSRRLLTDDGPSLAEHHRRLGELPHPVDLAADLEAAGLSGRGGAGFPSGAKLRGLAQRGGGVVVANAAEGEPASSKDVTLLHYAPHLVLDGLDLVARTVRAKAAYVAVSDRQGAARVRAALAERGDRRTHVVEVPDRFVSGEESALVNAINGRAAVPSDRLVRVFERGVDRRPTLVNNVETLAHAALVARYGPDWFRSVGTTEQPGTFLATVTGAVPAPGVVEVAHGTPLSEVLHAAGGHVRDAQAALVGGFHGAWVPGRDLERTRMTRTGLAPYHAVVGAGVVLALGRDQCGLVESAGISRYLADQVAGQCGPCINGLPRMAETLTRLARGDRTPGLAGEVGRLQVLVTGRGACTHPDGTARFVASTMRVFADEVAVHQGGGCSVSRAR